ncbi:MAG: hypothetical protein LBM13_06115 [Candidatus Ancillula sp.]|jgi:hypothetical protein|nr:hypothetical protein [Candidatus Ancillula sp.]
MVYNYDESKYAPPITGNVDGIKSNNSSNNDAPWKRYATGNINSKTVKEATPTDNQFSKNNLSTNNQSTSNLPNNHSNDFLNNVNQSNNFANNPANNLDPELLRILENGISENNHNIHRSTPQNFSQNIQRSSIQDPSIQEPAQFLPQPQQQPKRQPRTASAFQNNPPKITPNSISETQRIAAVEGRPNESRPNINPQPQGYATIPVSQIRKPKNGTINSIPQNVKENIKEHSKQAIPVSVLAQEQFPSSQYSTKKSATDDTVSISAKNRDKFFNEKDAETGKLHQINPNRVNPNRVSGMGISSIAGATPSRANAPKFQPSANTGANNNQGNNFNTQNNVNPDYAQKAAQTFGQPNYRPRPETNPNLQARLQTGTHPQVHVSQITERMSAEANQNVNINNDRNNESAELFGSYSPLHGGKISGFKRVLPFLIVIVAALVLAAGVTFISMKWLGEDPAILGKFANLLGK